MKYKALSVVVPAGDMITQQAKSIEVCSWAPEEIPLHNIAIVQNQHTQSRLLQNAKYMKSRLK